MRGARRGARHEPLQLARLVGVAAFVTVAVLLMAGCTPRDNGRATPGPGATPTGPGQTPVPPGSAVADLPDAPVTDPLDLARRYRGFSGDLVTPEVLYASQSVDYSRPFWIIDPLDPSVSQVQTTVRHIGEHAVWYVADDLEVDLEALEEAARRFDNEVFPHVMQTFGPDIEIPGRVAIVTAQLNGFAGYFTSSDALPQDVYPYSNERVGVYMAPGIGTDRYLGTLAHELQHVVHWLASPSEETWVNEGLAEFAARSMALPALPYTSYLREPDVSLTHWPNAPGEALPNYAGGSLFMTYIAQRTGIQNIHLLVSEALDGVRGIEAYVEETGPHLNFEDLFADWLVANLVGATAGPYAYAEPLGSVDVDRAVRGPAVDNDAVNQYGAWYLDIEPGSSPLTVRFNGRTATSVLPLVPRSGEHCWWGNRGDSINSTLTRELDLTGLTRATLQFWIWQEIEENWDHGYVSVSTDRGETWRALAGRHTRTDNTVGATYGPSYSGNLGRWTPEEVDLSDYAGREVLLRFEYITDEAISATGWCIDDIEVPQIGLFDDAESGGHGWEDDGFVRLSSRGVQQRYILQLVEGSGDTATVTDIRLDDRNDAVFVVDRPATLVVTAMAPKTSQPAAFSYDITR